MKRAPSKKPAVKQTLALFIALLTFRPGIGRTPKSLGVAAPADDLPRATFKAVAPAVNGGRSHGFLFKDDRNSVSDTTPKFIQIVEMSRRCA
jgi:hypothetical protein